MRRTFIAVKVEAFEKLREAISVLKSELRNDNIKWVDHNNMHITLAFIGDTDELVIKMVTEILRNNFTDSGEINFSIKGLGVFRNFNDPKIIWAGIENPSALEEAHHKLKKELAITGIELEDRHFRPHLTLGRIKDIRDFSKLQKAVESYSGIKIQDVIISGITYYESILLPTGPLYKPISMVKLR